MNFLLQQLLIADSYSQHNGSVCDIFISNGVIQKIAPKINQSADNVFSFNGCCVSPGWVDVFAHFCEPGFEWKETLETGAAAAKAGGYTHVFVLPNILPYVDNKASVEYFIQKSAQLPVTLLPLGGITKKGEGKELAEMYDMRNSGAVAFSDGLLPLQSSGLMLKALQYVKAFDGVIIQLPLDKNIAPNGLMHEGIISAQLGLPGLPALAEELCIQRDIELAAYTQSSIHFTGISTAKGLQLITAAKQQELKISCSVTPFHLSFCDEDLNQYDTNLKVMPPLRTKADMLALRQGVLEGTVDCIATHHTPQDWDSKTCEFERAQPGMIGLQTAYSVVQTLLPQLLPQQIANLFAIHPRRIFQLPSIVIEEGNEACLTIFHTRQSVQFHTENNFSKSSNSPFLYQNFIGKPMATVHKQQLFSNF